jgi:hypothetical protein
LRAAEQDRADIAEAREEWQSSQPDLNPERLVFLDETGAKTNMVRLYGRAFSRLCPAAIGWRQRSTQVRKLAPFIGPSNTQGAVISSWRKVRYLPAYCPDVNPIEQAFAKLKAALRKAAARTFDTLIEVIADALDTFTPEECANYIANSGYRRQSWNALDAFSRAIWIWRHDNVRFTMRTGRGPITITLTGDIYPLFVRGWTRLDILGPDAKIRVSRGNDLSLARPNPAFVMQSSPQQRTVADVCGRRALGSHWRRGWNGNPELVSDAIFGHAGLL